MLLICLLLMAGTLPARAQVPVDLGGGAEALYYPAASHIALLLVHRTADFRSHPSIPELTARGFPVLGVKTRFVRCGEACVDWEAIALDVRAGVRFLRSQRNVSRVVLVGHSGGGPTASYYQAVAEKGASFCRMPGKLTTCTDEQMQGWRDSDKADGIVFVDAHSGIAINVLLKLNGAVSRENDPSGGVDPELDPFSEANGYDPKGDSNYSPEFVDAYAKAQSRRMNHLIEKALKIEGDIEQGRRDPADNAFVFHRASARLPQISTSVLGCTTRPRRLLRDDGTVSDPQTVCTVRLPDPRQKEADARSTQKLTATSFLSANAIRSTHALEGIDWCSTNNSTVCAVRHISVPVLVAPGQAHYFIWDGEQIYENARTADKTLVVARGMNHGLAGCARCPGGPYPNAARNLWDFVRDWLNARF